MSKLEEFRQRYMDAQAASAGEEFERIVAACESPIEELLLAELLSCGRFVPFWADLSSYGKMMCVSETKRLRDSFPKMYGYVYTYTSAPDAEVFLYSQFPVQVDGRKCRLDFAIAVEQANTGNPNKYEWVAVECDGHDYHERTKEQAKADRSRDRLLTASGWRVVRFTGSELFTNTRGCVDELIRIVDSTRDAR